MATADHRQERSRMLYRKAKTNNYLFKDSDILSRVAR
jgi:hypothetical protein